MCRQFTFLITVESDLDWAHLATVATSEAEANTQIAAALRHHLRKAGVTVVDIKPATVPSPVVEFRLKSAMNILDRMDDDITERGGDDDEYGRIELAKVRRLKGHIRKALGEK